MSHIELQGVRQNNLKNIDVEIPLNSFTVVCGPSGSGKSSLAFETLFAEGQRRYIESLSSYARQFLNQAPKPLLDEIKNIPPAIALEQKNTIKNSRSTVGTTSEVIEYLRLLFSKIGKAHCPHGHGPIEQDSPSSAGEKLLSEWDGKRVYLTVEVSMTKKRLSGSALLKSFLKEGYTRILVPSGRKTVKYTMKELTAKSKVSEIPKKNFYIVVDRLAVRSEEKGRIVDSLNQAYQAFVKFNEAYSGQAKVISADNEILSFSEALSCSTCGFQFPQLTPQFFSFNSPIGACENCNGFGNSLDIDEHKVIP